MNGRARAARYLIGGVIIGAFWYLNRGRPAWEEAARTIVVFAVLMTVLRLRLRRAGVEVHLIPLIAAKATLVVLAALVEWGMRRHGVPNTSLLVALGLALAVAGVGAAADRHFFSPLPTG